MKADNHAGLRPFFVREAFLDKNSRTNSRTKYARLGQILGQNGRC